MTPRGRRLLAVALLIGLLGGLSVWHGTLVPNAANGRYPGPEAIAINGDVTTGDAVTIWGTVVATDPVVIKTEPRGQFVRFTLTGEPIAGVSGGTTVGVHGTLASPDKVAVDHALLQEPWELQYLYGISVIAGLWVLSRFFRDWQLEGSTLSFQPRSQDD